MKTEDLPSLADAVHAWTYTLHKDKIVHKRLRPFFEEKGRDLREAMRRAHRFTLDDAFLRQVVRKGATKADKMLAFSDLANLPFDTVFIEYDNTVRIHTTYEVGAMQQKPSGKNRGRSGFLLERVSKKTGLREEFRPDIYTATYFTNRDEEDRLDDLPPDGWMAGPAMYVLSLDGRLPDFMRQAYDAPEHMRKTVENLIYGISWGYGVMEPDEHGDPRFTPAISSALVKRGAAIPEGRFMRFVLEAAEVSKSPEAYKNAMDVYHNAVYEGRGDLRFIVTALAMINCVPIKHVAMRPQLHGHYSHGLRNVPYLENKIITLHCGKVRTVSAFVDHHMGVATRRRRHGVRGFWRDVEYGKAIGCAHEPVERDGNYCLCGKCGHLLRWIEHHERGDATLGYVRNDYEVKI